MTKSRGINTPRHSWTVAQLAYLRAHYPDQTAKALAQALNIKASMVYTKARRLGLEKSAAFMASAASGRLDGVKGAQTRFFKGQKSWNLNKKGLHFSEKSEFKKGSIPANVQDVGALRINSLGDLDIKVAPGKNQWVSMRRYCWESERGPIPPNMCIVPVNGDGHDTRIDNLKLVTRAENIRINLLARYPKELRNVMALRGRLKTAIQKRQEQQPEREVAHG